VPERQVCDASVLLCKWVAVGQSVLKHRHINIVLEGIDTVADVMLNDVLLVSCRNMFQQFVIDVTDVLQVRLNSRSMFIYELEIICYYYSYGSE